MSDNTTSSKSQQSPSIKITHKKARELVRYVGASRAVVLEWLDKNPDVPLPSGLVAALIRSQTTSIHVDHDEVVRRFHDEVYEEQYGDTLYFPNFGDSGESV
jgi:hypothetical protein